jgi:hypothetical protein
MQRYFSKLAVEFLVKWFGDSRSSPDIVVNLVIPPLGKIEMVQYRINGNQILYWEKNVGRGKFPRSNQA